MSKGLLDVRPHGQLRDEEGARNLVGLEPTREEEHDLELPGSEAAKPPLSSVGQPCSLGVAAKACQLGGALLVGCPPGGSDRTEALRPRCGVRGSSRSHYTTLVSPQARVRHHRAQEYATDLR